VVAENAAPDGGHSRSVGSAPADVTGGLADLHMHSTSSDGVYSPAEVAARAGRAGLSTVALTDHDTTAGWDSFSAAGAALGLRCIPAIELTCRVLPGPLGTVHVLGYGVDPRDPTLEAVAGTNRRAKHVQLRAILAKLEAEDGLRIPWEEVAGERGEDAYVGRNQVASVLVRRGVVKTRQRAFRRYLNAGRVPSAVVAPAPDALAAIHAAGGLAVLAHPTKRDLDQHLRPLLALGLRGIEAYRPRVGHLLSRVLRAAERHELLVTGGSDWHGHFKDPPLGHWIAPPDPLLPFLQACG
jgi:3',5'-nucleoside bisphosphate phosphatase